MDEEATKSRRARDMVNHAVSLARLDRWEEAIAIYTEVLSFEKYALPYLNRGRIYCAMGDYEKAIYDFTKAIYYNDYDYRFDHYIPLLERAKACYMLNDYKNAISDLNELISKIYNPERAEAYYYRGLSHLANEDRDKAITDLTVAAALGDKKALDKLTELGVKLSLNAENINKIGLAEENSQNNNTAFSLYKKAAEMGEPVAQNNLGRCYMQGLGVSDKEAGIYWTKKSAEAGCPAGQHNLGIYYLNGNGLEQSYVKAKKWLKKAADQGFEESKKKLIEERNNKLLFGGIILIGGVVLHFAIGIPLNIVGLIASVAIMYFVWVYNHDRPFITPFLTAIGLSGLFVAGVPWQVIAALAGIAAVYFVFSQKRILPKIGVVLIPIAIWLIFFNGVDTIEIIIQEPIFWKVSFAFIMIVVALLFRYFVVKYIGILLIVIIVLAIAMGTWIKFFNGKAFVIEGLEVAENFLNKRAEGNTVKQQTATINTNVNFRSSPGTNSGVIGGFKPGDRVTVIGESKNGWTPVRYNGKSGWVSSKYIDLQK